MRKYYFTIASILVLAIGITSCSNEENKTQNQVAARPTVPIQNGEVQIGTQIWMSKNLNVSRYRNGDPIPQVTDPTQWENLTTGAWCYYNNDPDYGTIYGKLYNWYAVNDPRGLAPNGWHIPSDVEWTILTTYLGGEATAGGKMKATTLWNSPNTGATNSSGFAAIPAGLCQPIAGPIGYFYNQRFSTDWWSSTAYDAATASRCVIYHYSSGISQGNMDKHYVISVRCIKD